MKKINMTVIFLLVCNALSFAQCDKNLVIRSTITEYLDADSLLQRTVTENTLIEITKKEIRIRPGDKKMEGIINSDSCSWTTPFIEGKSIYNTSFRDEQGNSKNAVITISGKGGKLTLLLQMEAMPFIIRVPIDKFEEGN